MAEPVCVDLPVDGEGPQAVWRRFVTRHLKRVGRGSRAGVPRHPVLATRLVVSLGARVQPFGVVGQQR